MGLYPGPPMTHEIPGMEFSGTVAAVGARVTGAKVGDEVMGIVGGGAYAERLVTHERLLMPVPTSVPIADAAAIPEVFITAFDALVAQGGLTAGRTALVHAGASGVGTAAIQIAKAIGATVYVTASTDKVAACRELGADLAIDYRSDDFVAAVKDATGGAGVDVVLDVIGGDYVARNLACLAVRGHIIQVGLMGSGPTDVNVGILLAKRASITGTTLRGRPIEEKIAITRRVTTEVLPFFDTGALRPVIDRRFALDDIAAAHTHMASNANVGKILIDVD
jgi:NADPH2:quinone reductase